MKFLNHLDLHENEARKMKLYRVSAASYTPSVSAAGNVIFDTGSDAIPKWWDGSQWRDFAHGTSSISAWIVETDSGSGSNLQVDSGEIVDFIGGTGMTTATTGSASAPSVTINANTFAANSAANAATQTSDIETKWYGVQTDSNDKLVVHVPWTDVSGGTTAWTLRDDDDDDVTINNGKFVKFISTTGSTAGTNITGGGTTSNPYIVTIQGKDSDTTYAEMDDSTLGLGKHAFNTVGTISHTNAYAGLDGFANNRTYGVIGNSSGQLCVHVPWTDTTGAITSVNTTDGTYINLTPNSATTGAVTVTADLSAVNGSFGEEQRVLSKNNTWVPISSIPGSTDIDVNNAYLLNRLANLESSGGAADENIVIGADSGDTIVITGNLKVSGTTTTVDSTVVNVADNIITLNSNVTGTPSSNAGLDVERGSSTNVGITWTESNDTWYLSEATNQSAGGTLVSKKIIQNVFTTVTGNTGTASANSSTTALGLTGVNGITVTANAQAAEISGGSAPLSTVIDLEANSIDSATNKRANITHALGTMDLIVRTYLKYTEGESTTYEEFYTNHEPQSTTVTRLTFSATPPADVRVVIMAAKNPASGTSVAYA